MIGVRNLLETITDPAGSEYRLAYQQAALVLDVLAHVEDGAGRASTRVESRGVRPA